MKPKWHGSSWRLQKSNSEVRLVTNIEVIADTELTMGGSVSALTDWGFYPQAVRPSRVSFVSECPIAISTVFNIFNYLCAISIQSSSKH